MQGPGTDGEVIWVEYGMMVERPGTFGGEYGDMVIWRV